MLTRWPQANISYRYSLTDNIRTLSGHDASASIQGLLHVPQLSSTDCQTAESKLIPANVTRQSNLPNNDWNLVGLAPWISPDCVQEYLATSRGLQTRALLFYIPDNGTGTPPTMNEPVWGLGDGGAWKTQNSFPVYAIPGAIGNQIMTELALYSGNITDVPYGHDLAEGFSPDGYVRLYTQIDTGKLDPNFLPFPHRISSLCSPNPRGQTSNLRCI